MKYLIILLIIVGCTSAPETLHQQEFEEKLLRILQTEQADSYRFSSKETYTQLESNILDVTAIYGVGNKISNLRVDINLNHDLSEIQKIKVYSLIFDNIPIEEDLFNLKDDNRLKTKILSTYNKDKDDIATYFLENRYSVAWVQFSGLLHITIIDTDQDITYIGKKGRSF